MRRHAPSRPWQSPSPPLGSPTLLEDQHRQSPPPFFSASSAASPSSSANTTVASSTAPGHAKPFRPPTKRTNSDKGNPVLSAIGLAQPSLRIHLQETVLFTHPTPQGRPSDDPVLQGSVVLYLPKARNLKKLTVRLVGRQDIGWPNNQYPYESQLVLDKVISLFPEDQGMHLEKGEHTFAFAILIPSSTPTYERCPHGRVRHIITAKAKGLGAMNSDVTSEEKSLFLIANPGGPGASRPPPPLDYRLEGVVTELGPYTMAMRANYLMVGGLLLFRFKLVSPPTDVVIHSIKVKINQVFTIISHIDPNRVAHPPVDRRTIILLDHNNPPNECLLDRPVQQRSDPKNGARTPDAALKVLARGAEWTISHLGRIPNDNVIRPTTQEATESGIRVSHEMAVEVTYRPLHTVESNGGTGGANGTSGSTAHNGNKKKEGKDKAAAAAPERERKKMTVTKPIDMFSCCCFVDSLTLPMYSESDPHPQTDASAPPCVCDYTTDQLLDSVHGVNLLKEDGAGFFYASDRLSSPTATDSDSNRHAAFASSVPPYEQHRIKSDDERAASSAAATRSNSLQPVSGSSAGWRQVSPPLVNYEYGDTDDTLMTVSERLGQL